jgi:hypothetical protein
LEGTGDFGVGTWEATLQTERSLPLNSAGETCYLLRLAAQLTSSEGVSSQDSLRILGVTVVGISGGFQGTHTATLSQAVLSAGQTCRLLPLAEQLTSSEQAWVG